MHWLKKVSRICFPDASQLKVVLTTHSVLTNSLTHLLLLRKYITVNKIYWGDFVQGDFVLGGFCPWGDFVQWDFVRGILSGGILSGGILSWYRFTRALVGLSEILQVIWIQKHTSIHHKLTETENCRAKGDFYPMGHLGCFPILHGWINNQNFTFISLCGFCGIV